MKNSRQVKGILNELSANRHQLFQDRLFSIVILRKSLLIPTSLNVFLLYWKGAEI